MTSLITGANEYIGRCLLKSGDRGLARSFTVTPPFCVTISSIFHLWSLRVRGAWKLGTHGACDPVRLVPTNA
ncbi:MAG: hypothetical protein GWP33_00500 [Alphaproteobacteria bacterium]|nr:hypothetical protein [Alphaproteobacteria bacterium]